MSRTYLDRRGHYRGQSVSSGAYTTLMLLKFFPLAVLLVAPYAVSPFLGVAADVLVLTGIFWWKGRRH